MEDEDVVVEGKKEGSPRAGSEVTERCARLRASSSSFPRQVRNGLLPYANQKKNLDLLDHVLNLNHYF